MNYLECKSKSLFSRTFVYFDKEPYYSDDIFERNNIRVRIEPMETGDFPYHIIFAKVAKKDVNKFIKSMDDLKKSEIAIVDKIKNATELKYVSDFDVRNDLDFQKNYLSGRFGGRPRMVFDTNVMED